MICTTPFPHSGHPLGRSSSGPDYVRRRQCFSGMMQPVSEEFQVASVLSLNDSFMLKL